MDSEYSIPAIIVEGDLSGVVVNLANLNHKWATTSIGCNRYAWNGSYDDQGRAEYVIDKESNG